MSGVTTLVGRMGKDVELRFSAAGKAVGKLTIVTSRRQKNKTTQEWEDADVTWWDCVAFDTLAENCAESLAQGLDVVAIGRVVQESWEDKQSGQKRSRMVFRVDSIGPDLRRATARVEKATRAGFQPDRQGGQRGGQQQSQGWGGQQAQGDPWASQPAGQAAQGGGWGGAEEPPF